MLNPHPRIVCDPDLLHGEPCILGTRVPVSIIVANLAEMQAEDLMRRFPQLSPEDIKAALLFAAEASHQSVVA